MILGFLLNVRPARKNKKVSHESRNERDRLNEYFLKNSPFITQGC
jgi:hypothetical protein